MKKNISILLIILMIFVLLFSITILSGDVSKEEIVNELKKITVVANKDSRLEMYDTLSEKLGLKIADDPIIKVYSGNGARTTRPFVAETSWEMQWDTKDEGFLIYIYDGDGNFVGIAQSQAKQGSCYNPKKGTFYLSIFAMGNWEIKIIAVE